VKITVAVYFLRHGLVLITQCTRTPPTSTKAARWPGNIHTMRPPYLTMVKVPLKGSYIHILIRINTTHPSFIHIRWLLIELS